MWIGILITVLTVLILGFVWLSFAICRFRFVKHRLPKKKWKRVLCGAGVMTIIMLDLYMAMDLVNMVIVMLHLLIIWMLCDLINLVVKRIRKQHFNHYYSGVAAFVLTALWLGIGWYNAHHVSRTHYSIHTVKHLDAKELRVVAITDSHVGATFNWQEFGEYVELINEEQPDLVVIVGDYIDDDTSLEDMERCCAALGELKTRYGVFYVYGNHDEGYWNNKHRGYCIEDVDRNLEANGVKTLRDEMYPITEHIYLCGRLDKQRSHDRQSATNLMKGRHADDYVICLDHEPNDYTAEAESNMDLVISGHTHGGQFLGLGTLGVAMGANDAYYGHERRMNTDFIVSSGIGDWALRFKTGCISEYVVIDIQSD